MNNQNSTSGLLFGLAIFVGLLPLSFTFSQNGAQWLLGSSFEYVVWCGQIVVLLLLLLTKLKLTRKQLLSLSVLYALIPFTFSVNDHGVTFLILNNYISSILSWVIVSVLFSNLYFNVNMKPSH
jgi:hypothetical protein